MCHASTKCFVTYPELRETNLPKVTKPGSINKQFPEDQVVGKNRKVILGRQNSVLTQRGTGKLDNRAGDRL